MAICRRCWETLGEREPGVLMCVHDHGYLVDEDWLVRRLPVDSLVAWRQAVSAATPTSLACSACPGPIEHVTFETSWWSVLPRARTAFIPIVSDQATAERCSSCLRAWFDLVALDELRDRGPLHRPIPEHAPPRGVCPRCYQPLGAEGRCDKHGLLVAGGQLEPILDDRTAAIAAALARAPGGGPRCPVCTTQTRRVRLEGREVDACPRCLSVWLEAGAVALAPRIPGLLLALAGR